MRAYVQGQHVFRGVRETVLARVVWQKKNSLWCACGGCTWPEREQCAGSGLIRTRLGTKYQPSRCRKNLKQQAGQARLWLSLGHFLARKSFRLFKLFPPRSAAVSPFAARKTHLIELLIGARLIPAQSELYLSLRRSLALALSRSLLTSPPSLSHCATPHSPRPPAAPHTTSAVFVPL